MSECGTGFQREQSALPGESSATGSSTAASSTAAIQPERGGGSQLPHAPMANVCRIGGGVCYHRPTCGMVLRTARCELQLKFGRHEEVWFEAMQAMWS